MTLLAVIVIIGLAQPVPPVIMTQVPVHATEAGRDLPSGSRIVSYDPSRPDQGALNLTGGFHSIWGIPLPSKQRTSNFWAPGSKGHS